MRRSFSLCVVFAIGCACTVEAQISQNVSITVRNIVESKTLQNSDGPFNQTVQDSYSDMTGRQEGAYAQLTSSVSLPNSAFEVPGDISAGGEIRFNVSGPGEDNVTTRDETLVTFTLDGPANFNLTESSNFEGGYLGGNGEVFFSGATLNAGTTPVSLYQTNLIPYIFTLAQEPGAGAGPLNPITGEPNLTYSGTLSPGTYTYCVAAAGEDSNNAFGDLTFSSDFQITPVPEPLPLSLLGMGAVAMLRKRRSA